MLVWSLCPRRALRTRPGSLHRARNLEVSAYRIRFPPTMGQKLQRPPREYGRPPLLVGSRERRREHFLAALVRDGHEQNGDLVRRHRSEKVFGVLIVVLCPNRVSGQRCSTGERNNVLVATPLMSTPIHRTRSGCCARAATDAARYPAFVDEGRASRADLLNRAGR